MESLKSVTSVVVPTLLQLEGHRHLQAVYFSLEGRVACELPLQLNEFFRRISF